MNKAFVDAQKRVEETTSRLEKKLGLSAWWRIKHIFSETPDGAAAVPTDGPLSVNRTTACTVAQWEYRQAEITWYLPSVMQHTDEFLAWIAIHEYIHMLLSPIDGFLFDYLRDDESTVDQIRTLGHHGRLNEYVTETLARVVLLAMGEEIPA